MLGGSVGPLQNDPNDAGPGRDVLTINANDQSFAVRDAAGQVLYTSGTGGSTITVKNVETITVDGNSLGRSVHIASSGSPSQRGWDQRVSSSTAILRGKTCKDALMDQASA